MTKPGRNRDQKNSDTVAQKKNVGAKSTNTTSSKTASADKPQRSMSRRKLWAFRLATALGIPVVLFVMLELGLRIFGFGHPTSFLLRSEQYGKPVLVENDRFGWRFFGPRLARAPSSMSMAADKPQNAVRICVFGESAAFGDPQPDFGLPRMLQTMLSIRHPETRFEVINAAMTGINSHVVRAIAKDCVATNSDVWVVYMGNNEVVGPFGAGTVFGSQTPALPLVRANLAFKTTRVGQLLEKILPASQGGITADQEWGGMEMFTKNQVARDDPRMERVSHHFRSNLEDIIDTAQRNKIGVVVSTVGVNLRDCAPFASVLKPELSAQERLQWATLYRDAIKLQQAGNEADAAGTFANAAAIDESSAEVQFRWGQSLLKTGKVADARRHLQLACDLDQLRFRCDSRLNEVIRDVASGRETQRVRFVDAAEKFHEASSPQVSGKEFFYEHVHLTFEGNYLLARVLAEQVEALLPAERVSAAATAADWPTRDQCANRLAWSRLAHINTLLELLRRLDDPPFTSQLNHAEHLQDLVDRLTQLQKSAEPTELAIAAEQCRRAVEAAPDDHVLHSRLAYLLGQMGDLEGAYQSALRASQLLPHNAGKLYQRGIVLETQQHDEDAVKLFREGLALNPADILIRHEMAKALIRLGKKDEALDELRHVVAINPRFGPAYLTLGMLLEASGKTKEAEENYRLAVKHRVHRAADLVAVAQICQRMKWFDDAVNIHLEALRLTPFDPNAHLGAGQALDALGRFADSETHFLQLVSLLPQSPQARYQLGVHYARQEQPAKAAEHFQAAADMDPNFTDARIDFGMALIAADRRREALDQFNIVLAKDPKHKTALEYKEGLEKELGIKQEP